MPVLNPTPRLDRTRRPRRRRTALLTASSAVLAVGLAASAVPASSAPEPGQRMRQSLQAAPAQPQTPFERVDGERFSTAPEAYRFIRRLDASSERVAVERIGRSNQGRPLLLVKVGEPAPASVGEAADGSVLMYNCSIHGDEPSGREACMALARDLATTNDPQWERLLQRTTVLFINSNPDGWVANTRRNAQDLDINRDFMELATPEGRAIARTIRDWKPDVLNDLHEYGPREYYNTDLLHLWPRNRNVDEVVYRLAKRMSNDYSAALVESAGYTAGVYGHLVKNGEPFQQIAGDGQARILRNYSGTQNVVGMLSETANEPLDAEEEADVSVLNRRRVAVNYTSAVGSAQLVLENRGRLIRQTAAADERKTREGATQSGVVYFAGQDDMLPTSSDEVDPTPMCGYTLTADQLDQLDTTLALHGITVERRDGGTGFVSMAQPDEPLIPLLLDARYQYHLVEATPVDDC